MPTLDTFLTGGLLLWLLPLASFLVGLSKGGLPAVAMLAVPMLSLVMSPVLAAVLLLPIYILSDAVGVYLYRHEYSRENLTVLIPAGFAGVLVGWVTATSVSDQIVSLLIGLLGIGFCLNTWSKHLFHGAKARTATAASLPKGAFWGTVSGFTSFVSHAGAPPYQIYMLTATIAKDGFRRYHHDTLCCNQSGEGNTLCQLTPLRKAAH